MWWHPGSTNSAVDWEFPHELARLWQLWEGVHIKVADRRLANASLDGLDVGHSDDTPAAKGVECVECVECVQGCLDELFERV